MARRIHRHQEYLDCLWHQPGSVAALRVPCVTKPAITSSIIRVIRWESAFRDHFDECVPQLRCPYWLTCGDRIVIVDVASRSFINPKWRPTDVTSNPKAKRGREWGDK